MGYCLIITVNVYQGIQGDNDFLMGQQYQLFDKAINISGFPNYMVITKESKLVRNIIMMLSAIMEFIKQMKEFVTNYNE